MPGKYSEPNGTILLVWEGQGIAGGVALRPLENKICEMKRLFVREQWRGNGLGEKLVKEIIRFAVTAGYLKMRLDTETRLEKAIELYQKFKFVTIEKYNDNLLIKVRSTGRLIKAKVKINNSKGEVNLEESEARISPGQACVFYSKNKIGDKVLGGGWITKTINKYLST